MPITSPFTVVIDTSEQQPYAFTSLRADARQRRAPLIVPTKRLSLLWGDYSIDGYARRVAVERKSYADLAGTLTKGRRRFMAELEALNEYDAAWVVVEAELSTMMAGPPAFSRVVPKTLWRSVMRLQMRFPRVHWWAVPGRDCAEAITYRLLAAWWEERIAGPQRRSRRQVMRTKGV